ncbi:MULTISPECIES: copper chaperone PCu(A)C [unclassified Nocardiopsis]|uniref:copper chaperone PCu(A)C n=1 Tax=unclassified Nocardiopsis TaxID=2649073 RepID=UPI001357233A|nr:MULTISPECIES: copper chaperone PCu(A)C [unclassified Nocardiopsis]
MTAHRTAPAPRPRSAALTAALASATAAVTLALTACGGPAAESEQDTTGEAAAEVLAADAFTVTDPWVKAATAREEMTAVFGELTNASDTDITLVAARTEAAGTVELHEVSTEGVDSSMREKEGGFVIPAGGSHTLEPGADHIMLMDLGQDLEPGAETAVTVEFADGSTATFTAPVKEYAGANEEYEGDGDRGQGHEGHGGEH